MPSSARTCLTRVQLPPHPVLLVRDTEQCSVGCLAQGLDLVDGNMGTRQLEPGAGLECDRAELLGGCASGTLVSPEFRLHLPGYAFTPSIDLFWAQHVTPSPAMEQQDIVRSDPNGLAVPFGMTCVGMTHNLQGQRALTDIRYAPAQTPERRVVQVTEFVGTYRLHWPSSLNSVIGRRDAPL